MYELRTHRGVGEVDHGGGAVQTLRSSSDLLLGGQAPLSRSMLTTLAEHDVQVRDDWVEIVGAVIGRDEAAIRAGVAATLGADRGADAFFTRLQLDELRVQSSMLL